MIRAARVEDLPALARIVAATPLWQRYGVTEASALAALERAIEARDFLSVSERSGAIDGLAWVQPRAGFGRSPYLKWLGVAPNATRGGVGRELLSAAEQAARAVLPELILLCSDFNLDAQRFYERAGYARVGALPDYVLKGVAELVYFKKL